MNNIYNLVGGEITLDNTIDIANLYKFKTTKKTFKVEPTEIVDKAGGAVSAKTDTKIDLNLYNIELSEKIFNRVLFIIPGLSLKSFGKSLDVISKNLIKIKECFDQIYILEYSSFTVLQTAACNIRDLIIENLGYKYANYPKKESRFKKFNKIYYPELVFNKRIASLSNEIINFLCLKNVFLLGKSNGAWISKLILEITNKDNDIYNGLYLSTPAIPDGVRKLNINEKRLKKLIFRFFFIKQDGYKFRFYGKSNEEKAKYDKQMKEISPTVNYQSIEYDNGEIEDKDLGSYHELDPKIFDDINKSLN